MRICFVLIPIEHYSPVSGGAIATVTHHVAEELEKQGHEVWVLAVPDGQPHYGAGTVLPVMESGSSRGERIRDWVEGKVCRWDWHAYGRYREGVCRWLLALRPEVVVFANDLLAPEWARCALPQARVGVWLHNMCRSRRPVAKSLKAADFWITCSEFLRGWYLREYALDPGRITTVLAGVDHSVFRPNPAPVSGPLRVLFVGRLDYNKGLDLATDAVRSLYDSGVPVRLTVAGGAWFHSRGIFSSQYVERMRPVMREPCIEWLGHVPRRWLPEVFRQHQVCLVLSRSEEPFGLVVLEAMASGLAVVTSGRGGLGEASGDASWIVREPTVDAVGRVLRVLQADGEVLADWRQKALLRTRNVSWEITADEFWRAVEARCPEMEYETVGT
jgi:glycosyltransferase involved in cell wall biosynthesis